MVSIYLCLLFLGWEVSLLNTYSLAARRSRYRLLRSRIASHRNQGPDQLSTTEIRCHSRQSSPGTCPIFGYSKLSNMSPSECDLSKFDLTAYIRSPAAIVYADVWA